MLLEDARHAGKNDSVTISAGRSVNGLQDADEKYRLCAVGGAAAAAQEVQRHVLPYGLHMAGDEFIPGIRTDNITFGRDFQDMMQLPMFVLRAGFSPTAAITKGVLQRTHDWLEQCKPRMAGTLTALQAKKTIVDTGIAAGLVHLQNATGLITMESLKLQATLSKNMKAQAGLHSQVNHCVLVQRRAQAHTDAIAGCIAACPTAATGAAGTARWARAARLALRQAWTVVERVFQWLRVAASKVLMVRPFAPRRGVSCENSLHVSCHVCPRPVSTRAPLPNQLCKL